METRRTHAAVGRTAAITCAGRACIIEAEWDPTVPHGNDRSFWCQQTQKCLGPDGKIVDDYECNPARHVTSLCNQALLVGQRQNTDVLSPECRDRRQMVFSFRFVHPQVRRAEQFFGFRAVLRKISGAHAHG